MESRSVNEYAAEFLRLNRFAPYMVAEEEKRASKFPGPKYEYTNASHTPTIEDIFSGPHHNTRYRAGIREEQELDAE